MTISNALLYASFIWTACAAGWLVIAWFTGVAIGYAVALGCAAVSGLCIIMGESIKGVLSDDDEDEK